MDKYIERRAIIEKLNEIGGCDATDEWSEGWDKAIDTAVKAAEKLPAADVVPVLHGHWAHLGGDEWCCSNCEFVITTEGSWEHPERKFCENCGARMDGGDKNAR